MYVILPHHILISDESDGSDDDWTRLLPLVLGLDSRWTSTGLAFWGWTRLVRLNWLSSTGIASFHWTRLLRLASPTSTGLAFLDWPGLRLLRLDAPTSTGFASATVL
jgi:hypothetical protein